MLLVIVGSVGRMPVDMPVHRMEHQFVQLVERGDMAAEGLEILQRVVQLVQCLVEARVFMVARGI